MIKNYLRVTVRTLAKNKAISMINIVGLAIGMTAFMFIAHYVRFELSYEDFNPNSDRVWRVTLDLYNGSEYLSTDCETHALLGPTAKEKFPEVEQFVRMGLWDGKQDIKVGTERFTEEGIYYADSTVFDIFSIKVLEGDPKKALRHPVQVAITESMAKKFFGQTRDVLSKELVIEGTLHTISALIPDAPGTRTSSIRCWSLTRRWKHLLFTINASGRATTNTPTCS